MPKCEECEHEGDYEYCERCKWNPYLEDHFKPKKKEVICPKCGGIIIFYNNYILYWLATLEMSTMWGRTNF